MKRTVAALLQAVLVLLGTAAAQRLHAETLQEAWQRAAAQDSRLGAASAELEAAQAARRAAIGARLPQLSVSGGYTRFADAPQLSLASEALVLRAPLLEGEGATMATAQLQLPLFTSGRISGGIAAAGESLRAADAAQRSELALLRLDVAENYVAVLRARRQLDSSAGAVQSLQAHVSDVQNMVERELVAQSDLLAARVALANAEQLRVAAANGVALALAAYNRRLGESLDRDAELSDHLPVESAWGDAPLEELVRGSHESRPELEGLSARASALSAQSRAARGAMLPQIVLTGSLTRVETAVLDRKDFSYVGIGLTWNLFDGGQAWNQASALRSASRAADARRQDLDSQIALQVRQAWLGIREARARVATAREAVGQAEENLRMSRELYGTGLATNTQVLEAVSLETSARNNRDAARLDEQLSEIRLQYAVGAL